MITKATIEELKKMKVDSIIESIKRGQEFSYKLPEDYDSGIPMYEEIFFIHGCYYVGQFNKNGWNSEGCSKLSEQEVREIIAYHSNNQML
ncbi:MAG: hypothetical protein SVK08_01275 [Halobacteriota archaeon]|nr:hypothetical protein [Halobacteriota archaeon]